MNRLEGAVAFEDEILNAEMNFKDVELQLRDILKKAGYQPPNQQRDRNTVENEYLVSSMKEEDFSVAINLDFKLFT